MERGDVRLEEERRGNEGHKSGGERGLKRTKEKIGEGWAEGGL